MALLKEKTRVTRCHIGGNQLRYNPRFCRDTAGSVESGIGSVPSSTSQPRRVSPFPHGFGLFLTRPPNPRGRATFSWRQIYASKLKLHPVVVIGVLYVAEHLVGVQGLIMAVPCAVFVINNVILGNVGDDAADESDSAAAPA